MKLSNAVIAGILTFCLSTSAFAAYSPSPDLLLSLEKAQKYNENMKFEDKPKPFPIYDEGTEEWVDYEKYGEFQNPGTDKYKYVIKDFAGLKAATGEGIFPNAPAVRNSPGFKKMRKKLGGSKWNYVNGKNLQANYYKWAIEKDDDPGVILYYTAHALDMSGNYKRAIKAYYACLVLFPKSVGYTQYKTPWYIAPVCVNRIQYLTKLHPELGIKLEGADVTIKNTFDNDVRNDVFIVNPGKIVPAKPGDLERKYAGPEKTGIKKVTGTGRVKLIQYNNNHYRLTLDDKPHVVRGITYVPNKVGLSPDEGTVDNIRDWSFDDYNRNKKVDGPYDTWVDANRNNKQDDDEKAVGDFALMKEMGVNTLRLYHHSGLNKELLKDGYETYGFMYMMGNLAGMYSKDSGASWEEGTNYSDPQQRANLLASVREMVEEYKNEPYVLMWVLGNENNYSSVGQNITSSQADSHPDAYYKFINECARLIKSLDPQKRPVAISNGDLYLLDYCVKNAPDIDIYGTNSYRGEQGFGNLWKDVAREYGKPVLITEYGCPAYAKGWSMARAEAGQAAHHFGNWNNIEDNMAGVEGGYGNALGGVIFEWSDEWWKAGAGTDSSFHDVDSQFGGAFLDGQSYEEWFGICSLGNGKQSTFKRQLRKSYFTVRELWQKYK